MPIYKKERIKMKTSKMNILETFLGGAVLVFAGVLLIFAYIRNEKDTIKGYVITAKFDKIDGLVAGSDVRMSGIKIGSVANQALDPTSYLAIVNMNIANHVKIPTDSSASVVSESLLGGKYMDVVPGGDDTFLKPGEAIQHTQSSVNFEKMIGQAIFSSKDSKDKKEETNN